MDGFHVFEQVLKEFINSIIHINSGDERFLNDTVPMDGVSALPSQKDCYRLRIESGRHNDGSWQGDVYELIYPCLKTIRTRFV